LYGRFPMRTNDPSDSEGRVQRVKVRRVGGPIRFRLPWRVWLLIGALALAGLAIFVLIVGLMFMLWPLLLLAAAAIMAFGWIRGAVARRRRGK